MVPEPIPSKHAQSSRNLKRPDHFPAADQDLVLEQIKQVSTRQIEEMKEIANELNHNFQKQMQAEKEQRLNEFKKFKRDQTSG